MLLLAFWSFCHYLNTDLRWNICLYHQGEILNWNHWLKNLMSRFLMMARLGEVYKLMVGLKIAGLPGKGSFLAFLYAITFASLHGVYFLHLLHQKLSMMMAVWTWFLSTEVADSNCFASSSRISFAGISYSLMWNMSRYLDWLVVLHITPCSN